jgi:hypothetical protein
MMILGVSMLGNLNIEVMNQKHLGMAFWRIVLSAGILAMVMSVINTLMASHSSFPVSNDTNTVFRQSSSPTAAKASALVMSGHMVPWLRRRCSVDPSAEQAAVTGPSN